MGSSDIHALQSRNLEEHTPIENGHNGGYPESFQESAVQQPFGSLAFSEFRIHSGEYLVVPSTVFNRFLTKISTTDHAEQRYQPGYLQHPDTHLAPDSTQWLQPNTPNDSYSGKVSSQPQPTSCGQCPSIWYSHLESMMFLVPGRKDLDERGRSPLLRSYKDLYQHVHEAHLLPSRVSCSLCEDLFFYYLAKLMLLEEGMTEVQGLKLDLGRRFMTLRTHIRDAHGGH